MDLEELSRILLSGSPELDLDPHAGVLMEEAPRALGLGLGEPWDSSYLDDVGTGLTDPHPSAAQAQSPLSPPIGDGDFFLDKITDEGEALEKLEREFRSQNNVEVYFSNHDQHRGVEHAADDGNQADNNRVEAMNHEHGSNNFHNHRAGDADAAASSQLVSGYSYNHGRDETDHSMNQEHSLINHKSSQGASCVALPEAIGNEDEAQSPYDARVDGEKLESNCRVPRVGLEFCSEEEEHSLINHKSSQGASCTALPEAIGNEDEAQSPYDARVDREKLESDCKVPRGGLEFCSEEEEHSLINHKSSQGASCSTLPEAIGEEDEAQSPYDASIDGEKLASDCRVPRVGLEFCSEEAVYEFYNNYAKQAGFNLRRGKAEYSGSNKAIIKAKYFLCSCQGHKSKEQIDKPTRYKRRDTRTGCEAKIKCVVSDGTWMISKVVLEHNHAFIGCLAVADGKAEDSSAMTALSTDNIVNEVRTVEEQALVSCVDCSDVSRGTWKNRPMPEPEDTQDLIDHFKNRQIQDPSFFYTAQVKAGNFFWRDSRSKIDYEHFGDVLVLDTRTEINKYDLICAAFWGLNHHQQRIIFGCAFLIDRTMASLKWLLRSFLEAMSWRKPQTIITEVSEEIADALRVDLPETSHCLPFWSIFNGFTKNLSPLSDQPNVSDLLSECIFHVNSQEEFELKWNALVAKYTLHENAWVASLYRRRQNWCHVFTKRVFSAGLLSIQNDEDARPVFGNLSCQSMTLSQIAQRCGEVAKHMRREEFLEDMRCEKIMANLQSRSPVEKEAERLYTRPIFRMLQKELINSLSLAIEEIVGTAAFREFKLTEEGSTNTVKFDPSNSTLVCSCGKFESVGILCFHTLKALNFMNIFKIPPRYILKRWTKSAKDSVPMDTPSAGTARDGGLVNLFMGEFMRQASHVAHMSVNKKRKRIAMRFMKLASEHIAKIPKTEEVAVALDNSDGNEDMDQTICECDIETQLEQDSVAKSGM